MSALPSCPEPAAKLAEGTLGGRFLARRAPCILPVARGGLGPLAGGFRFRLHGVGDEGLKLVVLALGEIWRDSPGFTAFRGESWMAEPCRSCERRAVDFGGCRCQAYHLTGNAAATDPVCSLSPHHDLIETARTTATAVSSQLVSMPSTIMPLP